MDSEGDTVARHREPTPATEKRQAYKNGRSSRPGARSTAKLMTNPMSIALMIVWTISCEGALLLNILADVFQSKAPVFPLVPTIATTIGLNTFCALLSALLGRVALRGFRLYQPFLGGQSFVVMQGFGYGILVTTSIMQMVYVEQFDVTSSVYRYGILTVLGCFSTISCITLMTSLLFFVPKRHRRRSIIGKNEEEASTDALVWWHDLSASPNGEIGIVVSFCFAILACCSFSEYYPAMRRVSAVVGAVFLVFGIFMVHVAIGYWYTPGYRLFMPNAGTIRMSMMQAFGWFLAAVNLHFYMILYEAGPDSPSSWHILCGLSSVISLSTLLLFVRLHRFPTSSQSEMSLLGEYGPLILTLASAIHAAVVWGVALLLSSENNGVEPRLRQGLVMCQTLCSLLTFAMPPCTHLLGRIAFGREYEVWMPFKGPLEFVVLQSAGWTCFGAAIFFATLQITENLHFRFVIIQSSLTAMAQAFIHASLHLFEEGRKDGRRSSIDAAGLSTSNSSGTFPSDEVSHSGSIDEEEAYMREADRSLVTTVLNGEMLTAILLSTIGLLVRVVADVAVGSGKEMDDIMHIPTNSLLVLSTIISFVVVPLAHVSMRERISIWQPFVGSGGYVAMQSIGWSVYAVNILIVIANSFVGERKNFLLPITDDQYVFLEYTMEGLFAMVPLVCLIMGAFFETQAQSCRKSLQERSRQEVLELYRVLLRAIPDEDDLRHAETLLKAIAGPRWMEPPATDGARLIREDEETARARQEAATHIVTILSVASALAFLSAAFLAERQPVFTLVFGAAGVTVTTISSFSVHYVYGTFLHRASGRYSFFMPFSGGPTFVMLQAVGWGFYTASTLLIALSCAEGRGSAIVFTTAGVFSVSAQYSILNSVPRFDPTPRPKSLLERNAEGIMAVLALIGSFAFAVVYDLYTQSRITGTVSSLLPITVSAVSTCFAVPLGLVSLGRNADMSTLSPFSLFDNSVNFDGSDNDAEDVDLSRTPRSGVASLSETLDDPSPLPGFIGMSHHRQMSEMSTESGSVASRLNSSAYFSDGQSPQHRQHRRGIRNSVYLSCYLVATFLAFVVTMLVPFLLVHILYSHAYSGLTALRAASSSLRFLLTGFAIAVLVPLFAPRRRRKHRRSLLRRFYSALCCYAIYSIPTAVVVGSFGLPLVVDTMGARCFAVSMTVMSCISTIPYIHPVSTLINVCLLGYFLHYHLYTCLIKGVEPFALWKFVADTVFTGYWLWYFRRYVGRPHISGRLYSAKSRDFFRRYVFSSIADYFDLRIIVDGKEKEEKEKEENAGHVSNDCVDMNDPENKYLFSFHPHGVFPGTAMWMPNTQQWDKAVGCNNKSYVTSHCADVVFSVPMMRDFVLSVGGLSVSRKGIEGSIVNGNSPLIVTGGQAEMVLTKMSDTEMHLVTHHSGFVRVAMLHRVPLVPIICFAEHNVMANISLPRIQRYAVKKVGFPFPTVPYGRWYLPLPTTRPLTVVVGEPILPEPGMDSADIADHVQRYQRRYFKHLQVLFFKWRAKAGYPDMKLVLHNYNDVRYISQPETESDEEIDGLFSEAEDEVNEETTEGNGAEE
ncbi:putative diacylglycerol acyltransferase [Trypanosoma grayi]|uniref:putative diacylglycerol acyltransferase n=1 Tax=Trypanosoma grayi TaxID=71804 RepID=UPI0004F44EA5|nr:putative diacylglycerol acyltransferase [Trypanosoma grayi]KEG10818.1 putative diacylglycerol acyltransferase [Trypanosoma grayi]